MHGDEIPQKIENKIIETKANLQRKGPTLWHVVFDFLEVAVAFVMVIRVVKVREVCNR